MSKTFTPQQGGFCAVVREPGKEPRVVANKGRGKPPSRKEYERTVGVARPRRQRVLLRFIVIHSIQFAHREICTMPTTTTKPQDQVAATVSLAVQLENERRAAQQEADRIRSEGYLQLLRELHEGVEIAPETILERLAECGVSVDRLQSNIEQLGEMTDKLIRLTDRHSLREQSKNARAEKKEIEAELEKLTARLKELETTVSRANAELLRIDELRHELRRLAPSNIGDQVRAIEAEVNQAQAKGDKAEVQRLRDRQDELLQAIATPGVVVGA